jgi:protein-tyrosine phosphatase
MIRMINRSFGTHRGLIRSALGYLELATGRLNGFRLRKSVPVRRLVFVCQGNICRSAFAEKVAAGLGLPAASIGLSTTTGAESPREAVESARRQGIDLTNHRALDWADFKALRGDLFLVMEIRQARELRRRLNGRSDVSVSLLGLWCAPRMPHIHDPFTLSEEYFDTCFARVHKAVKRLGASFHAIVDRDDNAVAVDARTRTTR